MCLEYTKVRLILLPVRFGKNPVFGHSLLSVDVRVNNVDHLDSAERLDCEERMGLYCLRILV